LSPRRGRDFRKAKSCDSITPGRTKNKFYFF